MIPHRFASRTASSPARRAGALALAFALAAALALPAAAQQAAAPERTGPDPAKQLAHLTARLDLRPEQQEKIRPILEEQASEIRSAREEARASGDRSGLRSSVQEIRERTDQQIAAQLDDAQKQAFENLRAEQQERVRERMGAAQDS